MTTAVMCVLGITMPSYRIQALFVMPYRPFLFQAERMANERGNYNDPYEASVYVQIEDDDAEGLEEVLCFLNENAERLQKDERNYYKKIPYRIEANIYEGMDYSSGEDVAKEAMEHFEKHIIDKWLERYTR